MKQTIQRSFSLDLIDFSFPSQQFTVETNKATVATKHIEYLIPVTFTYIYVSVHICIHVYIHIFIYVYNFSLKKIPKPKPNIPNHKTI